MWIRRDWEKYEESPKRLGFLFTDRRSGKIRGTWSWVKTGRYYHVHPMWYEADRRYKWIIGKDYETVCQKFRTFYDERSRMSFREFIIRYIDIDYPTKHWLGGSRVLKKGYVQDQYAPYPLMLKLKIQKVNVKEENEKFTEISSSRSTKLYKEDKEL